MGCDVGDCFVGCGFFLFVLVEGLWGCYVE